MNNNFVKESHFEYYGRDCIVVFNQFGFRCGYVSVNKNDKDFEIIDNELNYQC